MSADRKKLFGLILAISLLVIILVLMIKPNASTSVSDWLANITQEHETEASEEEDEDDEDEATTAPLLVRLDESMLDYAGIETLNLSSSTLLPEFKAFAAVVDIRDLIQWRSRLNRLHSAITIAKVTENAARLEWNRLKALAKGTGSVASKNVNYAETAWREANANLQSATFQLDDAKAELTQSWGESISRWVLDHESKELERLIKRHDSLLMVTLPIDRSLPANVNVIRVSRAGDRSAARKSYFVSPAYMATTHIQGETYYFKIPTGKLRLGQRLDAWIPENNEPLDGLFIPDAAVVWYSGQPWAYVQIDEKTYQRRSLAEGTLVAGGIFVQSELSAGEKLVISGAQMLLSEEFRWQIHDEDDDDD